MQPGFRRDDRDYLVFCFAERADAERFLNRYAGRWYDPKQDIDDRYQRRGGKQ